MMSCAHLRAAYGTTALAALQTRKPSMYPMFAPRINTQVSKCCCVVMLDKAELHHLASPYLLYQADRATSSNRQAMIVHECKV